MLLLLLFMLLVEIPYEEIIEVYFLFIVLGGIYHYSLYFMGFILLFCIILGREKWT